QVLDQTIDDLLRRRGERGDGWRRPLAGDGVPDRRARRRKRIDREDEQPAGKPASRVEEIAVRFPASGHQFLPLPGYEAELTCDSKPTRPKETQENSQLIPAILGGFAALGKLHDRTRTQGRRPAWPSKALNHLVRLPLVKVRFG